MAENTVLGPLPKIAALPPTTAKLIGSSQVFADPSSVVKELIDNALDARANAILVDTTANTIDAIQVKDTGHGIPQEDRPLTCRPYCTSKIRDFSDLKAVGGKWLGFRGEALASMAEISGTLEITTRVEGEAVAMKMTYGRDGELISSERASVAVGTTVKVTDLFKALPVRKQSALKQSSKWLAKIRRLMQSYALARPAVRLSLRVLKAKSNKGDFLYAPRKDANVEDAVLKVLGTDCALQCEWTAAEIDGFEIRAFLPKPDSDATKIARLGGFVAVDGRPVSTSRGILKQLVTVFRERLHKANPKLGTVRDPFFVMNILCPPNSYDPNIEPAKDDVLFEDGKAVVAAVDKLLVAYYPEAVIGEGEVEEMEEEHPTSFQHLLPCVEPSFALATSSTPVHEDSTNVVTSKVPSSRQEQPRWRYTMYGIDEEDLGAFGKNRPVIEEEEGRQDAAVSNPWTITRMCASVKSTKTTHNGQLVTPAKSRAGGPSTKSYPVTIKKPPQTRMMSPLDPHHFSSEPFSDSSIDCEPERSVQPLPGPPIQQSNRFNAIVQSRSLGEGVGASRPTRLWLSSPTRNLEPPMPHDLSSFDVHASSTSFGNNLNSDDRGTVELPPCSSALRHSQKPRPQTDKPRLARESRPNGDWFGRPMHRNNISKKPQGRKRKLGYHSSGPPYHSEPSNRRDIFQASQVEEGPLTSENNTDIRDFFGRGRRQLRRSASEDAVSTQFSASANAHSKNHQDHQKPTSTLVGAPSSCVSRVISPSHPVPRASSAEPPSTCRKSSDQALLHSDHDMDEPPDITDQLRACVTRHAPNPSTTSAKISKTLKDRDAPVPEPKEKGVPTQRRTTDGLKRPISSRRPLERIPLGYGTHNIILPLVINIKDITRAMHGLDLAWEASACGDAANADALHASSAPLTNRTLDSWALKTSQLVTRLFNQENKVNFFENIRHGILTALARHSEGSNADVDGAAKIQRHDHFSTTQQTSQQARIDHIRAWMSGVFAVTNGSNAAGVVTPGSSPSGIGQHTSLVSLARTESFANGGRSNAYVPSKSDEMDIDEWLVPEPGVAGGDAIPSPGVLGREVDCAKELVDMFEDDEMLNI